MYRNGMVYANPNKRAKSDQSLRGLHSKSDPDLGERIVKNTYKTLLTRGQKECDIYCEDAELRNYLKMRILQSTMRQ